ncbi:hypothetical protein [Cupriavidus taiwanensis]
MTMTRLTGQEAERQAAQWITEWSNALANELAPYEAIQAFEVAFDALQRAEELLNLPLELKDKQLMQEIAGLPFLDIIAVSRSLKPIADGLAQQFDAPVVGRLTMALREMCALATTLAARGIPAAEMLSSGGGALAYIQSRRRLLLAVVHSIPTMCRGTQPLPAHGALGRLLEIVEHMGVGIINMHHNVMLARVFPDFELAFDTQSRGVLANRCFEALDQAFLEPERVGIMEMPTDRIDHSKFLPVSSKVIFSAAELNNDLIKIAGAYAEFNLQDTSYGALSAFIMKILPDVTGHYLIKLSRARLLELMEELDLPSALRMRLVVDCGDFVQNTCTHAPFTAVGETVVTSVVLLSRFAYHWKNVCLNRVRRYQIRSGFIFEGTLKKALEAQGFKIQDIKRVNRAEFDVVAVLEGVIYNLQCKNNLVDLDRIETDVKKFARYNRTLDKAYAAALDKERGREQVLMTKLGLNKVKHYVISRFPVATDNPNVFAFGEIQRFRVLAEAA